MKKEAGRVSRFVGQQVWAIRESTLDVIVDVLRMRAAGIALTQEEVRARVGAAREDSEPAVTDAIGVLPLYGVIGPRMNMFLEISGGTSLAQFMAQFRVLRDDPKVRAIVADIDSPGGSVFGVPEAFDEIYAARRIKPLVAAVNPTAASAALWIASAFSEIVSTKSGEIGSLGVFMVHEDWSKANDMLGLKPTYISAGKYKVEGNPDEPLGDETRAYLQTQVETVYSDFVKAVAKGRRVSGAEARERFGEGRMLLAKAALAVDLLDGIETLEQTITRLAGGGSLRSGRRAESIDGDLGVRVHVRQIDEDGTVYEDGMPLGQQPLCLWHHVTADGTCKRCGQTTTAVDTNAGSKLYARLLPFDGAVHEIVPITLHRDAIGITRLVGVWPSRTAFSVELLDVSDPTLCVIGDALGGPLIRLTLGNAQATYRPIGRHHRTIVADLVEWSIDRNHNATDPVGQADAATLAAIMSD